MRKEYPVSLPDVKDVEMVAKDLGQMLSSQMSKIAFSMLPLDCAPSQLLLIELLEHLVKKCAKPLSHKLFAVASSGATNSIVALLSSMGACGKEVITTSLNYPGVINAIITAGATPVFVDVEPETFLMDVSKLPKLVSKKTAAVIVTHVNSMVDVDRVANAVGDKVPIIEDAALAIASCLDDFAPGTNPKSKAAVFSFVASKIICGFGGGAMVSPDADLIRRFRAFIYQGYDFDNMSDQFACGANFKPNELSCFIAVEQMARFAEIIAWRKSLAEFYDKRLANLVKAGVAKLQRKPGESVVAHYALSLEGRDELVKKLWAESKILTGLWIMGHRRPIEAKNSTAKALPNTESLADRFTFLPFLPDMKEDDVDFICKKLEDHYKI